MAWYTTLVQNAELTEALFSDWATGGHSLADTYASIEDITDPGEVATLAQDEATGFQDGAFTKGLGPISGGFNVLSSGVTGLAQFFGETAGQAVAAGLGGLGTGLGKGAGPSQGSGGSLIIGALAVAAIYLVVRK